MATLQLLTAIGENASTESGTTLFSLPRLPFRFDACEPWLNTYSMRIHHRKHHGTHVRGLNALYVRSPSLFSHRLETVLRNLSVYPADIRNSVSYHGGGHFNHCLYWQTLTPVRQTEPDPGLYKAIVSRFGSLRALGEEFIREATHMPLNGWVWMVMIEGRSPSVELLATAGEGSPLEWGYKPLLGIDLWEHAYHSDYLDLRDEYVVAWWRRINWRTVSSLFEGRRLPL